jgi:hypothetical protein
MIGGRLLLHRRRTNKMFAASRSSHDAGKGYVTIVGILAESAVLYSSCCLIFVVFLQTNSPALNWWGGPLSAASVRGCVSEFPIFTLIPGSFLTVPMSIVDHPSHGHGYQCQLDFRKRCRVHCFQIVDVGCLVTQHKTRE